MKIKILSDLHMEGRSFHYEWHGEDVVILAGDIHTKCRHCLLLDQIPAHVKVLMVAGNHEYYDGDFNEVNEFLKALEHMYDNFKFLNNEVYLYKEVPFFGGTMFTDFTLDGEAQKWFAKHAAKDMIADFRYIDIYGRRWNTTDHEEQFNIFLKEFKQYLKHTEGMKRFVITHFMPTPLGTPVEFMGSVLNPYFTQNMEKYMGWEGTWVCGHGHQPRDVMIGDTRVIMNPKGYRGENANFNPELILEI